MKIAHVNVPLEENLHLHCTYAGNKAAPLLLFLHGFPEYWGMWEKQLDYFSQHYFVVAPDLRGYNESSKPIGIDSYALENLVYDIEVIREFFTKEKIILIGHDWGGFISWAYASQYPQHLEKLIIINAPHPTIFKQQLHENTKQQLASHYIKNMFTENVAQQLEQNDFSYLHKIIQTEKGKRNGWLTKENIHGYIKAWSKPNALISMCHYYQHAFKNENDKIQLCSLLTQEKILVPTLIIWGEQDKALLVDNILELKNFAPNHKVKFLQTSHWVVREKSREVIEIIEEFITPL